jgi:hypothetical protein
MLTYAGSDNKILIYDVLSEYEWIGGRMPTYADVC